MSIEAIRIFRTDSAHHDDDDDDDENNKVLYA